MKTMAKVTIDLEAVADVWPWVMEIPNMPRKKKKAAKKRLSKAVVEAVEGVMSNWEEYRDLYDHA